MTQSLGISLDGTQLSVAWMETNAGPARWQARSAECDGTPESVDRAIASLAPAVPPFGSASVTLGRPLAHTRTIDFPRMARGTIEEVLSRDWPRHVIGHRVTPHVVSARAVDRGKWLAAFAPADVLEALAGAAQAHGWRLGDIRASDDALAGLAGPGAPGDRRNGDCCVVLCDATGFTHAVTLRGGLPWIGRRFLADATCTDIGAFIGASQSEDEAHVPVVLVGHVTRTGQAARELGAQGVRTRSVDPGLPADASANELLAVAATVGDAALPLSSPQAQLLRSRHSRGLTQWLAIAAVVALLAGLGLERWRVQRELAAVQRARAEIAAPVRLAVTARAFVTEAADVAAELAEREAGASRVSGVLAAVALALPAEASLTALRVAGDSVMVEGESSRSAAVYDALRSVTTLEQVKLAAPLRQERQAGDVAVERFAFSARIRSPAAASPGAAR